MNDQSTTAATASTSDVTVESVMDAMDKFRVLCSEHVKPGTLFVMNPADYLHFPTTPLKMWEPLTPPKDDGFILYSRFAEESLFRSLAVPSHILYGSMADDIPAEQPETFRASLLAVCVVVILLFLLGVL